MQRHELIKQIELLAQAIDERGMARGAENHTTLIADMCVESGEALERRVVGIDLLRSGIERFNMEIKIADFGKGAEAAQAGVDHFRPDADAADDAVEGTLSLCVQVCSFQTCRSGD